MYINRIRAGYVTTTPEASKESRRRAASDGSGSALSRGDQVDISEAARALASQHTRGGLTPERIREIRQQIERGAYNAVEVAEEVARRLLKAGVV